MVMVLIAMVSGIMLPSFSGTLRGSKLRSAARTIERIARYGRSMAIMREERLTMVINPETMEVILGGENGNSTTNESDGVIDQEVLKRLGYVEGDDKSIDREIHRVLPEGLEVSEFDKAWTEEDDLNKELYLVRFYPNGQCDWFQLELEDKRGLRVLIENDPVSGKTRSEFVQ